MEGIQDESDEWLSSHSSGSSDIISPRVGDQYQVELPPVMAKDESLRLMEEPVHFGLPIPVTWVHDQFENINGEATEIGANPHAAVHIDGPIDSESSEESHITINSEDATDKVATLGSALDDGEEIAGDKMEIDLVCPQEKMRNSDHGYEGCVPVPGLSGEAWTDIERDSFLLGLYIFGKNLCLVKKIVGSKGIGEILSYYHGKFYRSSKYRRWSECRKNRNRRCIYGERIFTSWRQQELLSRFSSHVSEECNNRLIESSRIFGEGKLSLEEYVLALKDMVGIKVFVEAVAIGKGKQDLTGMPAEHVKTSHSLPTGKECSSLTMDEIVKFLTGDIRLSKTRSNDLFWEAVWPRLLARGWHSEQPRNYVSLGSKHSLVFLVPGVKKFSRRRLVKGIHYFDSLTDVLNKVALEPKLLELEPEVAKLSMCKEEGLGQGPRVEQDSDGFSSRQRHCYLQPRVSQCTREQMKFTIVDTSLVFGKEWAKVIELRSLPADPTVISTPAGVSGVIEQNTTKESRNGVEEYNIVNVVRDVMESKQSVDTPKCEASTVLNNHLPNSPDPMISATDKHEDQKQPNMPMKFKFSRKVKSSQSNDVGPTTKKHELTACGNNGSSDGVKNIYIETKQNGEESFSLSADNVENNAFQAETFEKPSSANSLEHSPLEKIEETWIDLNLPHVPPDSDNDEPLLEKLSGTNQQRELFNPSNAGVSTEQHPVMNGQRQSTRNRPLTTKALEALACGYLSPKKKRKGVEAASQNNSMSKPPRRVRAKTALLTSCGGSIGDEAALHKMEKGVDDAFNGSSHMVCGSRK